MAEFQRPIAAIDSPSALGYLRNVNAAGSEVGIVMLAYLVRALWPDTSDNTHRSGRAVTIQHRRFGHAVAQTRRSARSFGRWIPNLRSPFALLAAASWLAALADFSRSWPPSALDALLALGIALCFSLGTVAFQALYQSRGGDTKLTPWQFCGLLSVVCLINCAIACFAR